MTKESQPYQEMLNEVETIVKEVASPQIDLDQMVTKVERGYQLIQAMQDRLNQTKSRIEDLSTQFNSAQMSAGNHQPESP